MFSRAYKTYVLAVLTAVYTLNLADRGLMILLLQPIKEDLHLSDTKLGFITGIAFGLFYATLGVPIARWADRGNRVTISSLAIGLWGVTVMASLWVTSYFQLVFARIAAAVGEAGCKPPTYSLLGDYFVEPAQRTRAMAVYLAGNSLAGLASLTAGGWLNERYGWRMTFVLVGIPGLVLAAVVKATIAEPRTKTTVTARRSSPLPSMNVVFGTLWRQRSCRHLSLALIVLYTVGLGLSPWYAAFLMRSHGMATRELGVWLGAIFGLGGAAGVLLGGYIVPRLFADNERGYMRLCALVVASLLPCFMLFLLAPGKYQALAALFPLGMVGSFFLGPSYALLQRLIPDEMRATSMAVVMLFANLIGMGVGPQLVGILSDALNPLFGRESLRYAMSLMSFITLWGAYQFWTVSRTLPEDLIARAKLTEPGPAQAASP